MRAVIYATTAFLLAFGAGTSRASVTAAAEAVPELPRKQVDMAAESPGRIIRVPAGGDFQGALDAAAPGDTIELERGAPFEGPFTLPSKPHHGAKALWITIRSSDGEQGQGPAGVRVTPGDAVAMAKLEAPSGPVLRTAAGAHHYRLSGVEIRPSPASAGEQAADFHGALVWLGADSGSGDAMPHHIIIDRCYIHGLPGAGSRRGIVINSASTAVVDSYLAGFKMTDSESQAIIGWEGTGPYLIRNNYLEAAGENLMFGGADPAVRNRVPADIEIRGNLFSKPATWRPGADGHDGKPWLVKNLFELKNARRVWVVGNVFENNWVQAQNGFAILFTVRNQEGNAPWSVVEDVTFTHNIVRHTANGINILGRDDNHRSGQTRRILIANNLFVDLGGRWGGEGHLLQLLDGTAEIVFEHNTALNGASFLKGEGAPHQGFVFRRNIVVHEQYGIIGSDRAPGIPALDHYFPAAVMRGNVISGASPQGFPADNEFPPTVEDIGFVNPEAGDFRLARSSPFRDGKSPAGVDFKAFCAALSESERPAWCLSSIRIDQS